MKANLLILGLGGVLWWLAAAPPASAQETRSNKEPARLAAPAQRGRVVGHRAIRLRGGDHTASFVASGYEDTGRVVKGAPYSAESITETVQTLADGNRIVREQKSRVYRDSQGRTRREQTLGSIGPWASQGAARTMVFIHDPVAKTHYVLHPEQKTVRKLALTRVQVRGHQEGQEHEPAGDQPARDVHVEQFAWVAGGEHAEGETHDFTLRVPAAGYKNTPSQKESLGTRNIEGVEAEGARITMTIPAGEIGNEQPIEIVSERWHSPELQLDVLTKRQDPRVGETTYRLTNIQRVEPLPSLFEVPPDYTLREGPALMRGVRIKRERVKQRP